MANKKIGFYHKSKSSNKELVKLFEKIQYQRLQTNWQDPNSVKQLNLSEIGARKAVLKMLKMKQICTADDFYRVAMFFQHGNSVRDYALATALAAVSSCLKEPWGKPLYAMCLDRFMLAVGQKQYFGTNFEKRRGKWRLSPFNKTVTDKERKKFMVPTMEKILSELEKLNRDGF